MENQKQVSHFPTRVFSPCKKWRNPGGLRPPPGAVGASRLANQSTWCSKADRSCVNKTGQLDLLTTTLAPIRKKIRQLIQRRLAPLTDLHRMHVVLRSQLAQRPLAADCFQRHPGFELRTVLLSRRRHRLSLRHDSAENSNLLPGLKSWDHYKAKEIIPALLTSR